MLIYEKIRDLRKSLGLSQQEFAEQIGLSRGAYSQFEIGRVSLSIEKLSSIVKIFNIDANYFFDDSKEINIEAKNVHLNVNPDVNLNSQNRGEANNNNSSKPNIEHTAAEKLLLMDIYNQVAQLKGEMEEIKRLLKDKL